MVKLQTISFVVVVCMSIGIFFYLAEYGISTQAVPSLQQYLSSTTSLFASSYFSTTTGASTRDNEASVAWLASSTVMHQPFGGNESTSLLPLYVPNGIIYSYVARTPPTRERGLSGRTSLDADHGMLFIFPHVGEYAFWMKDMDFAIDIVWITAGKKVVGISENISPKTYPKTFSPPSPIQFVLEVRAGYAKEMGLKAGSVVSF